MPCYEPMPVNGPARLSGFVLCAILTACGGRGAKAVAAPGLSAAADRQGDWRQVATPADRARLRSWRGAWIDALAQVRAAGLMAQLDADPALFDPDRALPDPVPPSGAYRCRVTKLGANGTAMRALTAYPVVDCGVDATGGVVRMYKIGGGQRPVGTLYEDSSARTVFLGTMVIGDEHRALPYGKDGNRDLAGYVERIGTRRWRLVLPSPRFESLLDVVEIVPVG